jgi:Glycosyl transferases group 1
MLENRVFVVGAYIPNGGTFMAYHLGRVLHQAFGFQCVVVGREAPDNGVFEYAPVFPSISAEEMQALISNDDILIANASFSPFCFGLNCRGIKVMYVQGFNTFNILDCRYDHYVSVSHFVQAFLKGVYGIDSPVIPPFIRANAFPVPRTWRERPEASILISLKGDRRLQQLLLDRVRELVSSKLPNICLDNVISGRLRQNELMRRIGEYRHFLTLSVAEGFGLMPLEAMALGATVLGFDGFGGSEYMQAGVNCAVARYPNIEGLAEQVVTVLSDARYAETLAAKGRSTATSPIYAYDRFRADWTEQFSRILGARA